VAGPTLPTLLIPPRVQGLPLFPMTTVQSQLHPNYQPSPGPLANAVGAVVPETSPNLSGSPPPTPKPETPKAEGWWKSWGSDVLHGTLDVIGLVPVLGEAANAVGALVYLAEGDPISAAFDAAAMWPAGGQAATAGKYAAKAAVKLEKEVAQAAAKKLEKEAAEALEKKALKEAEQKAAKEAEQKAAREGGHIEGNPVCKPLAAAAYAQAPEVAKRFLDMMEDKLGIFKLTVNPDGTKGTPHPSLPKGSGTWHGHEQQLRQKQKSLRDTISAYDAAKCTQPKIVKPIRDLAYQPIPKSPGGIPGYPFTSLPK
jgi:hypothetical protein